MNYRLHARRIDAHACVEDLDLRARSQGLP